MKSTKELLVVQSANAALREKYTKAELAQKMVKLRADYFPINDKMSEEECNEVLQLQVLTFAAILDYFEEKFERLTGGVDG